MFCCEYEQRRSLGALHNSESGIYLFREDVIGCRKNVGNERAVFDVLVVTNDMDGIVTGLSGPVAHVTGAIALIIAFNFSLRRAFDGEACGTKSLNIEVKNSLKQY